MDDIDVIDKNDLKTDKEEKIEKPPMYRALLHNDDFTPPEVVVHVLQKVFKKHGQEAFAIMLHAHVNGLAQCGIYPKDVAETKVAEAMDLGKSLECALLFSCEKVD